MNKDRQTSWPRADSIELIGFNRTLAEIEWLLLALILVYLVLPTSIIDNRLQIVLGGALFAVFVIAFRYLNLFAMPGRWKLTIETWAMLALTALAVWHTGKADSPLLNLFLLSVIFSALTLGKLITLLEVGLIASFYLLAGYATHNSGVFSPQTFSELLLNFTPLILTAYVTALLSADIAFARSFAELQSDTDELTGLMNMRAFYQALGRHEQRSRRTKQPFSILMVDLDNLKAINDSNGHGAGDEAIRAVATAISGSVRERDVVARYGGDEFVALLPSTPLSAACRAGERIVKQVEGALIGGQDNQIAITVSIGVATYPTMATETETLLQCADKALYESKRAGRNRISIYSDALG